MNELLSNFTDITSRLNQAKIRQDLIRELRKIPMSISSHAKSIGISGNSLGAFMRGGALGRISLMKIQRFIDDSISQNSQNNAI